GPAVVHPEVTVPTLPQPKQVVTADLIATSRMYRMWTTPDTRSPEATLLALGGSVLGGLSSSRLDNEMVRRNPVAVSVSAGISQLEDAGIFLAQADVRPGEDAAAVAAKLDEQIAEFLRTGPTADELQRAKTTLAATVIRQLESTGGFGGKAPVLAEGQLYAGDPGFYRTQLEQIAAGTPEQVTAALRKWLQRPVFELEVQPGPRTAGGEKRGGAFTAADLHSMAMACYCGQADCTLGALSTSTAVARSEAPSIAAAPGLDFPDMERATLSNGVEV